VKDAANLKSFIGYIAAKSYTFETPEHWSQLEILAMQLDSLSDEIVPKNLKELLA